MDFPVFQERESCNMVTPYNLKRKSCYNYNRTTILVCLVLVITVMGCSYRNLSGANSVEGKGVWVTQNDNKVAINKYRKGKLHGRSFYYFNDGSKSVVRYKNGKEHGKYMSFMPNGVKYHVTLFRHGKVVRNKICLPTAVVQPE